MALMENIDAGGTPGSLTESSGTQSMYNIAPSKSDNLAYRTAEDRSLQHLMQTPKVCIYIPTHFYRSDLYLLLYQWLYRL